MSRKSKRLLPPLLVNLSIQGNCLESKTVANKKLLSVPDKLLLAAYHLEETGRRPFSAEDLVVAAWRQFPDTFSLAGYRGSDDGQLLYPDSNRVFAEIMGTKPIRKRGLLIKVGNKM